MSSRWLSFFSGSIPEALVSTYFVLASAMACRIFRATLLGIIENPQPNTAQIASFYCSANQSDSQNIAERHDKTDPSSKLDIGVTAQTMKINDGHSLWGWLTGHSMQRILLNVMKAMFSPNHPSGVTVVDNNLHSDVT
jgi:hypothetical protein